MSKNFNITITEKRTVEVIDAKSLEEAIQTVKDLYYAPDVNLKADNLTSDITFEEQN